MSARVIAFEIQEQSRQLMDGPLKHIRAAALAAALVPLASVFAAPASAQTACASGGVCGTVFNDTNGNNVQDAGDTGLGGRQGIHLPDVRWNRHHHDRDGSRWIRITSATTRDIGPCPS